MNIRRTTIAVFAIGVFAGALGTTIAATMLGSSVFPDVDRGSYYDEAIGEMYSLGIITGFTSDGTFRPNENLTRGQAAVLMQRLRNDVLGITPEASSSSARSRRSSSQSSSSSSSSSEASSSSSISPAGMLRFTTSNYSVDEDAGTVRLTVVRTGGKKGLVVVEYETSDGTATKDVDYEPISGTLQFADGESSKTIIVKIENDTEKEDDETINLIIKNATGGAGYSTPTEVTITIRDDESASSSSAAAAGNDAPEEGSFIFSAMEYSVAEDAGEATITIERIGGTKGCTSVKYLMADGTASTGTDYSKSSGVLSFGDGETSKTFTVGIEDDQRIEGNKTIKLSLTLPTGGSELGTVDTAVLKIYDDEAGTYGVGAFKFEKSSYEGTEEDGFATITVNRVGGASGEASVNYETIPGSATAGSDYESADGALVFRDGESRKWITITIFKDALSDGGETVNIKLSNPTGDATVTTPSNVTLRLY